MRIVRALLEGVSPSAKRAKAKVSKENVTTAERRVARKGVPRAKMEESPLGKETVTKEKVKDRGAGERVSGRWTEKSHRESGSGSSRRRTKIGREHRVSGESD